MGKERFKQWNKRSQMNTSEEAERREKEKERYCPFTAVRSKKEAYENVCHCTIHSDTPAMPPVSSIWFSYNIANRLFTETPIATETTSRGISTRLRFQGSSRPSGPILSKLNDSQSSSITKVAGFCFGVS